MHTRQISIFLENKKGRLEEITKLLASEGVNIRALYLADTADFGVLRLIVNDRERCLSVLRSSHGIIAQETEVVAVEVSDEPGGLHRILGIMNTGGFNIEYMYAFVEKKMGNAIVIFKVDAASQAVEALRKEGFSVLSEEVIANL